ncbi:MAG: LysR family transcriptional regulator [Deferrisomatales bacterium]
MDLGKINLNLLVALKALLEECHVTRAAERVRITQSGMSKNLAQLRELLSDPLLVRSGNALVPTARALDLKARLDALLEGIAELLSEPSFTPAACRRHFTVAATDYVAQYILPGVVERVFAQAPGVGLTAVAWEPHMVDELGGGGVDLATCIVDRLPPSILRQRIDEDRFVCCLRKGHPLEPELTLAGYVAYPHVAITAGGDKVKVIDRELARLGHARHVRLRIPYYAPAMEIVARTDLLLTLPHHIARNIGGRFGLVERELPFPVERFEYCLLWHARHDSDPAHRWVREQLFDELRHSLYSH